MRVLSIFNLGNSAYIIGKFLRRQGIDVHLILDRQLDPVSHPAWQEIEYSSNNSNNSQIICDLEKNWNCPDWIEFICPDFLNRKGIYSIKLLKKIRDYSIIHTYTMGAIWAQFSGKKYISNATGADLRELALENTLKGRLMRRGFQKAEVLFCNGIFNNFALKVGARNIKFTKWPFDIQANKKIDVSDISEEYEGFKIFCPARHDWNIKGTDILLKGYKKFLNVEKNSCLIMSKYGSDFKKSLILIKKLGIEKNVKFLSLSSQYTLRKFYKISDVVTDQFILGGTGLASLEALSFGKPLITYLSPNYFSAQDYKTLPPIINAKTSEDIEQSLLDSLSSRKRNLIKHKSLRWINEEHDWKKITKDLIHLYKELER